MRRQIAALATILATCLAGAARGAEEQALQLLEVGNAAGARVLLATAAAENLYYLAMAQRGEERQATLTRAAEVVPAEAGIWKSRIAAQLKAAAGQTAEAATLLREAAAQAPRDKRLQKELGDLLARQRDRAGAVAAYRAANSADPEWVPGLLALGDAQRAAGDLGGAYNAFNHAVGPDGNPPTALIGRASVRLLMGDADGAFADLAQAAQVAEPGSDRARALMGAFYLRAYHRRVAQGLDRVEQTIAMWQQLARPDMVAATCNAAGRVVLELGDPAAADAWYRRGWEVITASSFPQQERTLWQVRQLHGLSRVAAKRRDFAAAQRLADEAKQLADRDPGNAEEYGWIHPYLVGYVLLEQRSYDQALAELQRSDVERPFIQYLIAEAYARKRDREQARAWYAKALASATALDAESAIVRPLADAWLRKNPPRG